MEIIFIRHAEKGETGENPHLTLLEQALYIPSQAPTFNIHRLINPY